MRRAQLNDKLNVKLAAMGRERESGFACVRVCGGIQARQNRHRLRGDGGEGEMYIVSARIKTTLPLQAGKGRERDRGRRYTE